MPPNRKAHMHKRAILVTALAGLSAAPAMADRPPAGRLTLKAISSSDIKGSVEGTVHFLVIRHDGKLVARRRHGGEGVVFNRRLRPGRYSITTYARACVGSCEDLDAPSHRCTRTFRVRANARTTVTLPSFPPTGPSCPTTRAVRLPGPVLLPG